MPALDARTPGPEQVRRSISAPLPAFTLALLCLALAAGLAAQPATLVKDINPGSGPQLTEFKHSDLTRSGQYLYFTSDAGGSGNELWRTDGTAAGTSLVADATAFVSTGPGGPMGLTDVNGLLFFTIGANGFGDGLWVTDGSALGTKQLLDSSKVIWSLRRVGNFLFFFVGDPGGTQLWKSDGTPKGTAKVATVPNAGAEVGAVGDSLFFSVGNQLWKSNGKTSGTVLVKDIDPSLSQTPTQFTTSGNTLFFNGCDLQHGCELWKSDGTTVGTKLVLDIAPGPSFSSNPQGFFPFNGRVLFSANDGVTGIEPWISDGTSSGTRLLKDINPGIAYSFPYGYTSTPSGIYFSADDGVHGWELWRTDGSTSGTKLVADIFPGLTASEPLYLTLVGTNLFFRACDPAHGYELWKRDETNGVISVVQDVVASSLAEFQGALVFWGNNTNLIPSGDGLWKSNGTMAGTNPYKTFNAPAGSNPHFITANGPEAYFVASAGADPNQIWKSDGTLSGTQPLTSIAPPGIGFSDAVRSAGGKTFFTQSLSGSLWVTPGESTTVERLVGGGVSPLGLSVLGTLLLFQACGPQGCGLWASDGTASGTQLLSLFPQQSGIGGPIVPFGTSALFILNNMFPYELWKTDGTPSGTGFVKQFTDSASLNYGVAYHGLVYFTANYPGSQIWASDGTDVGTRMVIPQSASNLTVVNDTLFFSAYDPTASLPLQTGMELWMSDGTQGGTHLVKDINPGPDGSYPSQFVGLGRILYFTATDGMHGLELWRSDGTTNGTSLVIDLRPGLDSPLISNLTVSGGTLFFTASTLAEGIELWKSDGTPAGTVLVKDINPGAASSTPDSLTDVAGTLYFAASDATHGRELWKSDGTASGTALVRDIDPSFNSAQPNSAVEIGGLLYFSANDGSHGFELWSSDGTTAGTNLFADLYPGPASSGPSGLTRLGNRYVFRAIDETRGREPWITDLTIAGTSVLKDINPGLGYGYSDPGPFIGYNGRVYFMADDGLHGRQLWATDGSTSGTSVFANVPGATSIFSSSAYLFIVGGPVPGFDYAPTLWRSDGTGPGTVALANIDYTDPVAVGGELFFTYSGLWKTDGTPAGTLKIETTPFFLLGVSGGAVYGVARQGNSVELWRTVGNPGGATLLASFPMVPRLGSMTDVNGVLFFSVDDGVHGEELWKSDGTPSGTTLVKDIQPGSIGSAPNSLLNVGGKLLFEANDGVHGAELWMSDGTDAGTVLLQDINPGVASSLPGMTPTPTGPGPGTMAIAGNRVFFSATDNQTGTELWSIPMSAICAPPTTPTITSSQNPSCGNSVVLDAGPGYSAYLWSTGETARTITVSPSMTTAYSVVVSNATECRSSAGGVQIVDMSLVPVTPVASNNGPICAAQTLQLMASTVPGATYFWTGPNGFTSTQQSPQIAAATSSASGIYQVIAMVGGCDSAPAATTVLVRPDPSAAINADTIVCFNSNNNSASVPDAGQGATYSWTIGNGTIVSGAGTNSIVFAAAASGNVTLNLTVTDANGCSASSSRTITGAAICGSHFFSLTPCRAFDTRAADGPPLSAGGDRTIVLASRCGIPLSARSVSVNLTVTSPTSMGQLVLYPTGIALPPTSNLSYSEMQTRANNAILELGFYGDIIVHCAQPSGTVHLIIDVNGYFEE